MINLASCCTLPNANRLQNYALAAYSCSEGLAALGFWPGRQGTTSQQKLTAPHGDKASPYPIGFLSQGADLAVPPLSRAWGEWSMVFRRRTSLNLAHGAEAASCAYEIPDGPLHRSRAPPGAPIPTRCPAHGGGGMSLQGATASQTTTPAVLLAEKYAPTA